MENYVVTIARAYGSGGCGIGQKLAEELGIRFIDRELLQIASDESGISSELFQKYDENLDSKWYEKSEVESDVVLKPSDRKFTSRNNLYNYQARVIRELAQKESFVILGRAANYILRNNPNILSVNIQAPLEVCVLETMDRLRYSERDARKFVLETNGTRAKYYKAISGQNWLDPSCYDLSLNTSRLGKDMCREIIKDSLRKKLKLDILVDYRITKTFPKKGMRLF